MTSIIEKFLAVAETFRDRIAVIDADGSRRTYGELARDVRRLGGLVGRRSRGRTVGILLPTCKEFFSVYLGILCAGKVPVPVNFLLKPEEVRFICEDAGLDTLVTVSHFRKLVPDDVCRPLYLDELGFLDKLSAFLRPLREPSPDPDERGTILYTSGTTARPKGVVLTHENLLVDAGEAARMAGFDRPLTFLGVLPLFHSFALTCTLLIPMLHGGSVVLHKRFHPRQVLESVEREGIQILLAVPSMFRLLVKAQKQDPVDLSSVEIAIAGGEPLPEDLAHAFEEVMGLPLLEGYGLTETSPVISLNTPESHKLGTAGRPLPCLETRVVDLDSREELPAGELGELWVRGPVVMRGYHERPEETDEVMTEGGWLRTGDLAVRDEDGYISIRGREKELIIVAGENVSPGEIEDVLSDHPAVFEVAVLARPDDKRGEVPVAFVVLQEDEEVSERELLDLCRERLAGFKVPRDIVFREELPHGPTGKILKRAIRDDEEIAEPEERAQRAEGQGGSA